MGVGRTFPTSVGVLKRDIREFCGEVNPAALALIDALPETHPGFVAHHEANMRQYWKENPRALNLYRERHGCLPPELEQRVEKAAE